MIAKFYLLYYNRFCRESALFIISQSSLKKITKGGTGLGPVKIPSFHLSIYDLDLFVKFLVYQ